MNSEPHDRKHHRNSRDDNEPAVGKFLRILARGVVRRIRNSGPSSPPVPTRRKPDDEDPLHE